jgi:hypothetical protein
MMNRAGLMTTTESFQCYDRPRVRREYAQTAHRSARRSAERPRTVHYRFIVPKSLPTSGDSYVDCNRRTQQQRG